MFLLDSESGLHHDDVSDVTEAPAARDVDDAAPLVTAEGCLPVAATWAGNLNLVLYAAQAAGASGLVMLCHSFFKLLGASRQGHRSSSSTVVLRALGIMML